MPNSRHLLLRNYGLASLLAAVTLLLAGCGGQAPPPEVDGAERHFTGTWSFTGNQQLLQLAAGELAGIFHVEGSLLLAGSERPAVGYRAEGVGFSQDRAFLMPAGEYTFTWQRVAEYEDIVSGRVSDLAGWVRLAKPTPPMPTSEAKP